MNVIATRYRNLTDPLKTQRLVEIGVVVLAALFLLQLILGVLGAALFSSPEPVHPARDSLAVSQLAAAPELTPPQREEIRNRPLFWASRRPLESAVVQTAGAGGEAGTASEEVVKPGKIEGTRLTGVFGAGESAGIIVMSKGKKRRLAVGEEIEGWTLESVNPTEAVFSSAGREARLVLVRGKLEPQMVPAVDNNGATTGQDKLDVKPNKDDEDGLRLGRS